MINIGEKIWLQNAKIYLIPIIYVKISRDIEVEIRGEILVPLARKFLHVNFDDNM